MSSRVSCGDPVAYGESIGAGLYPVSYFFLLFTGTASRRVPGRVQQNAAVGWLQHGN